MSHARILVSALVALAAAGCDRQPTEADLRSALAKRPTATRRFDLTPAAKTGASLRVVGCAKAELRSYLCDVAGLDGETRKVRLVKLADDWSVVP